MGASKHLSQLQQLLRLLLYPICPKPIESIKGLRMAPTNATVPMEKKVELKEETKEKVDGCTQCSDKLLEGNIGEIAKENLGSCKCCGSNESTNAGEECPKGCKKGCCSKQCCGKCDCCEQKESNNADQDCPNKCTKTCCSNKCCTQCACCVNTESANAEQ